jgi:nitroimidazol reductase NimA-like FMN-containing flavoprotein (pyridoxamine 5'-phosphate oxidase superfamily)
MPRTHSIEDRQRMIEIINRCEVCHVAMVDSYNNPYVLPFNFGFRENTIFLHSAQQGKKMDILKNNGQVCIAFSTDYMLRNTSPDVACSYGMKYRSVLVFGKIEFVEDFDQKKDVLNIFMKKYVGREFSFNAPAINEVAVYKVIPEKMTGRESGY